MSHLPPPLDFIETLPILGVPLAKTDYAGALRAVNLLADAGRPTAVSACNTHLVALARQDPTFARVLRSFDLIVPDSTVLKWTMNAQGAGLADRVYGPYLMRHVLEHAPTSRRHFFFGGSEECLKDLLAAARRLQPEVQVVGTCSPPFGGWGEAEEAEFARKIREAEPDFIWVALGGERQEHWIAKNLPRHTRGVFLAVGDAFRLLAGHGRFAPAWMQRAGLNWLHRLGQEPARLWRRYFHFNSLYLIQLLSQRWEDARVKKPLPIERWRVAFLGARGVPARYAGFETVVEELGSRLAARGHQILVYNRCRYYNQRPPSYLGMDLVYLPNLRIRSLDTLSHSLLATLHCLAQPVDAVYLCGVGNACFAPWLRLCGKRVVINVDGIDFKRRKWGWFARWWLYRSEKWSVRFCDRVIADNREVVRHYEKLHGFTPLHLSYGVTAPAVPAREGEELAKWGLRSGEYLLYVGRLSPENEPDLLLRAYAQSGQELPLVMVGMAGYEKAFYRSLRRLAGERVIFTGAIYGAGYAELSRNCRVFILPAAIEATRLVLLDQMSFGSAIIFRESAATREVIADCGWAFDGDDPAAALAKVLREDIGDRRRCEELGQRARARAEAVYGWERILRDYERIFAELIPQPWPARGEDAKRS